MALMVSTTKNSLPTGTSLIFEKKLYLNLIAIGKVNRHFSSFTMHFKNRAPKAVCHCGILFLCLLFLLEDSQSSMEVTSKLCCRCKMQGCF